MSSDDRKKKHCFVISPIGSEDSAVRERSDKILEVLIRPVCEKLGIAVERADEIEHPGLISRGIILRLFDADLVIADLTGHNPNVFYELAIRHVTGKPIIQLIEHNDEIPFDISDCRTIHVDHLKTQNLKKCRETLQRYIVSCSEGEPISNPIIDAMRTEGVELPSFMIKRTDIEKQFQDLSEKILNEIKTLKAERTTLLDKVAVDSHSLRENAALSKEPLSVDLSGVWESSLGVVKLSQSGNDVIGEYDYKNVIGNIRGTIVDTRVVFCWDWTTLEGVGYWKILDNNQLQGLWFYRHQSCSYSELLENPTRLDNLITPNMDQWLLWRNTKIS